MIEIKDDIGGEPIRFYCIESVQDMPAVRRWLEKRHGQYLGFDTESTGLNCYHPTWKLRTFQFGDARQAFVIPAKYRKNIADVFLNYGIQWVGHNAPHDVRSLDVHLGFDTGVIAHETYIPGHHADPRKTQEGGIGHGLKDQAEKLIASDAGKWERELKKVFKTLRVALPGEVYKSGKHKGQPKTRAAHMAEGWKIIDPLHPAYIAYAAADPLLTFRVWAYRLHEVERGKKLYEFDKAIQQACDALQRRGLPLDVPYTKRYKAKLHQRATHYTTKTGLTSLYANAQIADTLSELGAKLTEKTPTGKFKTDDKVLKYHYEHGSPEVRDFIRSLLMGKRMSKRRDAYADAMLREMDKDGRIHPSINSLAARTGRMSISGPALQQLPKKDGSK